MSIQQMMLGQFQSGGGGGAVLTGWYGDRGIRGGGWSPNNSGIGYVDITSTGNASNFGTMGQTARGRGAASNGSRGMWLGGRSQSPGPDAQCEYITFASTGNGTNFGEMNFPGGYSSGTSDGTKAFAMGNAGYANNIDYFTFTSTGNGTDFGDMVYGRYAQDSGSYGNRAVIAGSRDSSNYQHMDYFTMGTTSGNASDFGEMTGRADCCLVNSAVGRAVICGGGPGSDQVGNIMEYVDMSVLSNASDFGDLNNTRGQLGSGGCANATRGLIWGGCTSGGGGAITSNIQYIEIATTSNSTDFGTMQSANSFVGAMSGS